MNNCVFIGRLTKDPVERTARTANGEITVASFTLAVNRQWKKEGEQKADFIHCVAFGKRGDFVIKYLKKGSKVCVEGSLQTGSFENKEGQTVYTTDLYIRSIEFAESKKTDNANTAGSEFVDIPEDSLKDDGLPFK